MTPEEILAVDAKRNHPSGTTKGDLIALVNEEMSEGAEMVRHKNVLILFKTVGKDTAEFHNFNADTVPNLIEANLKLMEMLKRLGYRKARTPYTNPKISDLFGAVRDKLDVDIQKDGDGYVAEVTL